MSGVSLVTDLPQETVDTLLSFLADRHAGLLTPLAPAMPAFRLLFYKTQAEALALEHPVVAAVLATARAGRGSYAATMQAVAARAGALQHYHRPFLHSTRRPDTQPFSPPALGPAAARAPCTLCAVATGLRAQACCRTLCSTRCRSWRRAARCPWTRRARQRSQHLCTASRPASRSWLKSCTRAWRPCSA